MLPALAATAVLVAPAGAAEPTPQPACAGLAFEDDAGDQASTAVPAQFRTPSTEITAGFLLHDAATGRTTFNIRVADLTLAVPNGYTNISWVGYFRTPAGANQFVRASLDLTGSLVYEYGGPDTTLPISRNVYQGPTTGRTFPGVDGVVQIDIPASLAPVGARLTNLYAASQQTNLSAPNAVPPLVTRGLTWIMDTAPDEGAESAATFTVAPCPQEPEG